MTISFVIPEGELGQMGQKVKAGGVKFRNVVLRQFCVVICSAEVSVFDPV